MRKFKSYHALENYSCARYIYRQNLIPPVGWILCVHPNGALYYRKAVDDLVFLTDADVTLPDISKKVNSVISALKKQYGQAIESHDLVLQSNQPPLEVVLDVDECDGDTWEYYIVDHASLHILWLCTYTMYDSMIVSEAHFGESIDEEDSWALARLNVLEGHLLKAGYYLHLAYYPHHQSLSDKIYAETRGMAVYNLAGELHWLYVNRLTLTFDFSYACSFLDSLASLGRLTPSDEKTMDSILRLLDYAKGTVNALSWYT